MIWSNFGIGLFLGTVVGIFVIGLLGIGAKSRAYDDLRDQCRCRYDSVGRGPLADDSH